MVNHRNRFFQVFGEWKPPDVLILGLKVWYIYIYLHMNFWLESKPWKWLNIYIEPKCWKFPSYWNYHLKWIWVGKNWNVQFLRHLRWSGCISNSHFAPAKLSWAEKMVIQGRKRKNHEVLAHADILNVCNQMFIFNKEWKTFTSLLWPCALGDMLLRHHTYWWLKSCTEGTVVYHIF